MARVFAVILSVALLHGLCVGKLFHVSVVVRHAARKHLKKAGDPANGERGAPLLYPEGSDMAKQMGALLRKRYVETDGETKLESGLVNELTPSLIEIKSSNLDRTLATAAGVAQGLSPKYVLPVEAVAEEQNDFMIRSYTKCSVFSERLEEFHNSEEFAEKEADTEDFRNKFTKGFPDEESDLLNWFNIYDQYMLAEKYRNNNQVRQPEEEFKDVSEEELNQMKEIVDWVELRRYGREVAGIELGSRMWNDITNNIQNIIRDENGVRLHIYGAHYPTMLSLLSTMDAEQLEEIPGFCDALLVEYYDDGLLLLHAKFEGEKLTYNALNLNDDRCPDANKPCPIAVLDDRIKSVSSITTNEAACNFCGNDVCSASNVEPASKTVRNRVVPGVVGFIIGVVLCAIAWLLVYLYRRRKRAASYDLEMSKAGYVPDIN
mmetsp:Transcript_12322/g.37575  ORF Transcript_12322/g.37575 Transcript_12322/m.37575 type:complete len:433 (+) Transcript_12322:160-1458(+)|eukprot:CAMPEP_0198728876 /NCGR_PEP_ID=MMETSP1475-20131203/11886_1 /TAXON_ID= ORGANISM="Unidentified sp., Strain CCMP1999" /NCGR_SAMPLE_ID=MMETSP1475 /ASSEMBLY_ACC=CAM_ASM_001111 /LENGTH=432 /DNA_ID=CAMNT_0044491351 /DNA_START=76 /DNA_END=1374 /DNA_ORIENTATION=+